MAIVNEGTTTGSGSGTSVSLTSWTPGSNELVLVAVALRDETISPSLSGNGLTFVEVANVDNVQGQNGINLFRAMGSSPSTGSITVTLTGNSTPVFARAYRFSGVDTSGTNGSGAVEASATNAGPATDNDDMLQAVTTVTDDAWAVAFGTHRAGTFTTPAGETTLNINDTVGSGGDITTLSSWYEATTTAGSYQLGDTADLDSNRDWCMVVVSIKPAVGNSLITGSAAGVATVSGAATGKTSLVASSVGVATATAVITGWGYISGSAAGVATVSGSLATGLAGSAAGAATVSGVLSATVSIAGTADGAATVTAVLSAMLSITGTAVGAATVSGVLFDTSLIVIPPVDIGYNARILIADPQRKILSEVQFALEPVGWMINDFGTTTITAARSDTKATEDILRPGNWLYVEFDNGLPPWAGILQPGRKFTDDRIQVDVASAEHYLKRLHTDKGRYFKKASVGYIVSSVIGEANAAWGAGITIGEMWGGGSLHSPEYHLESLWDAIIGSVVERLEDCEFSLDPSLENGHIKLTANLRQQRGVLRPNVWLIQGHNLTEDEYHETDELVNHWLLAGDDLSGNGTGWGSSRLLDLATGVNQESIGQYGLWQSALVEQGIREQASLTEYSRYLIGETAVPRVMVCASTFNMAPAAFADYQVGDTVRLIAPTATFQPLDTYVRVIGREFDFADGVCQLALRMVV